MATARTRRAFTPAPPDEVAANELMLTADNESSLYPQKLSIIKNLVAKKARGTYSAAMAEKLWMYWIENAAKSYTAGGRGPLDWHRDPRLIAGWNTQFTKPTRELVAKWENDNFLAEFANGEWAHLVPKKYQKPTKARATKANPKRRKTTAKPRRPAARKRR